MRDDYQLLEQANMRKRLFENFTPLDWVITIMLVVLLVAVLSLGISFRAMSSGCAHNYTEGPFYAPVAVRPGEGQYGWPSGMIRLQQCTKCGLLRLPAGFKEQTGQCITSSPTAPVPMPLAPPAAPQAAAPKKN